MIDGTSRPDRDKSWSQGSGALGLLKVLGAMLILAFPPTPCRCWIRSPMVHSILVMGYGGFTSLFDLVVLAWALWILCRLRAREKALSPWAYRDTAMVLGLTVLLGTTWTLAFFSFGVFLLPQLFLFTIFNSLYGMSAEAHRATDAGTGLVPEVQGWTMTEPTAPFKLV